MNLTTMLYCEATGAEFDARRTAIVVEVSSGKHRRAAVLAAAGRRDPAIIAFIHNWTLFHEDSLENV